MHMMKEWIALFRGINVGGKNIAPMAELRDALGSLDLHNVRTYIQSGNAVFESRAKSATALAGKIGKRMESRFGFQPDLLLLTRADLEQAVACNPFPGAVDEPKSLHFSFLKQVPNQPKLDVLERLKADSESFALTDKVFYLHAPDGIGRSKLAAKVEHSLGVAATGRNYRTVAKLLEMVSDA